MKKRSAIHDKAEQALKEAVQEVVDAHKKSGRPLSVWEDGKVKKIKP